MALETTLENPYAEVYGLTGIIGSGKSTAAKFLSELGAYVIDADAIAKSIYDPSYENFAETKRQIILQFGQNAFSGDLLNKQVLAELAFKDHDYLQKLNAIIHPQVKQIFKSRLREVPKGALIVYDVPLLFEVELNDLVKAVILVYVPEELAVKRALSRNNQARNNQAEADIRARLKKQISIEKKRKMADYVIDNSGDLKSLYEKLNALYRNLTNGRK